MKTVKVKCHFSILILHLSSYVSMNKIESRNQLSVTVHYPSAGSVTRTPFKSRRCHINISRLWIDSITKSTLNRGDLAQKNKRESQLHLDLLFKPPPYKERISN